MEILSLQLHKVYSLESSQSRKVHQNLQYQEFASPKMAKLSNPVATRVCGLIYCHILPSREICVAKNGEAVKPSGHKGLQVNLLPCTTITRNLRRQKWRSYRRGT